MNYVALTTSGVGSITVESSPLGKGGEGSVFAVTAHDTPGLPPAGELVVKKYHSPQEGNRGDKIAAMVLNPPETDSLAWPLGAVTTPDDQFAGYVMRKLDYSSYRPWSDVAHAKTRRELTPDFSVLYALVASRNLAVALMSTHNAGAVLGDVNESNIFVGSDASVMIVDTDSAQVTGKKGEFFPCLVGKPEYTAPELTHGKLKEHKRTPATDVFALGVALFQIFTGGAHPTDGVYSGAGDPPGMVEKIRGGIYPGLRKIPQFSPLGRVPTGAIPSRIRDIIARMLAVSPKSRPTVEQVVNVLDDVEKHSQKCGKVATHFYDSRDGECLWCVHAKKSIDPWSNTPPEKQRGASVSSVGQKKLGNISFAKESAPAKKAPRSSVKTRSSTSTPSTPRTQVPASPQTPWAQPSTPSRSTGNATSPPVTYQPIPPIQQPAFPPDPPPRKIKGKTVLTYPNGSWGVRPPLADLYATQPGLALKCFFAELPDPFKFWYPGDDERDPPTFLGTVFALIFSLMVFPVWWWVIPWLLGRLPVDAQIMLYAPVLVVVFGFSAVFVILHTGFNMVAGIKYRHRGLKENGFLTALRGFFVTAVWTWFPLWCGICVAGLELSRNRRKM